jgi:hypothetical protein
MNWEGAFKIGFAFFFDVTLQDVAPSDTVMYIQNVDPYYYMAIDSVTIGSPERAMIVTHASSYRGAARGVRIPSHNADFFGDNAPPPPVIALQDETNTSRGNVLHTFSVAPRKKVTIETRKYPIVVPPEGAFAIDSVNACREMHVLTYIYFRHPGD